MPGHRRHRRHRQVPCALRRLQADAHGRHELAPAADELAVGRQGVDGGDRDAPAAVAAHHQGRAAGLGELLVEHHGRALGAFADVVEQRPVGVARGQHHRAARDEGAVEAAAGDALVAGILGEVELTQRPRRVPRMSRSPHQRGRRVGGEGDRRRQQAGDRRGGAGAGAQADQDDAVARQRGVDQWPGGVGHRRGEGLPVDDHHPRRAGGGAALLQRHPVVGEDLVEGAGAVPDEAVADDGRLRGGRRR